MKDAKGHGSDPKAGHKLAADYRGAHRVPFNQVPSVREAVMGHAKRFIKDTGGSGKAFLHEIPDDTEKYQNALETYAHLLHHGGKAVHHHVEPSHLMHLTHFIHTLAAIALASLLVQGVAALFGVHLV